MFYILTLLLSFTFMVNAFPTTPFNETSFNWDDIKMLMLDDIIFPEGFDMALRSGMLGDTNRWPNKALSYQLDPEFSAREVRTILAGMDMISSKTCITFREKTTEKDFVYIVRGKPGSGCKSYVGRRGGQQDLTLQGPDVSTRGHCVFDHIIAHELIHALGFFHEQSRVDRDEYVTINWDNIKFGAKNNFELVDSDAYGIPYDYYSIMHYGMYDFARDSSQPTIIPHARITELGGDVLTPYDVQKLQRHYRC